MFSCSLHRFMLNYSLIKIIVTTITFHGFVDSSCSCVSLLTFTLGSVTPIIFMLHPGLCLVISFVTSLFFPFPSFIKVLVQ